MALEQRQQHQCHRAGQQQHHDTLPQPKSPHLYLGGTFPYTDSGTQAAWLSGSRSTLSETTTPDVNTLADVAVYYWKTDLKAETGAALYPRKPGRRFFARSGFLAALDDRDRGPRNQRLWRHATLTTRCRPSTRSSRSVVSPATPESSFFTLSR